ncbi:hypothetical protein F5X96DRAFT_679405 [Biscogniauxia mediterranea]|nr:hypothetical protein F5X96DRAFT_679405 [Biscogniauxia mediterranea]
MDAEVATTTRATATSPLTFPLFSNLPPELRNHIWRDALPNRVGPALCSYRKGLWRPRRLTASDEGYDPENDELNLLFEFRYDLLDGAQVKVPLLLVNREARSVALPWVREQGIEIRPPCGDGQDPMFVRPFSLARDALYVPVGEWDEFIAEPLERSFEPDLIERHLDVVPHVTRLAVPEVLLERHMRSLDEMFQNFFCLEVLLVVLLDASPDLPDAEGDGCGAPAQWEFLSGGFEPIVWDHRREEFSPASHVHENHRALYEKIEQASTEIGIGLSHAHMGSFEIQPCYARRR